MSNEQLPQHSNGHEQEVHLSDYLNVVLRRWKIVLLVFLLVFVGVTLKTFLTQPVYEAYATLEIRKGQKSGMLQELGMGEENTLSTEVEVLRSRSVAEKVARRMNLEWQIAETSTGLDVSIEEFTVSEPLPGLIVSLVDAHNYQVSDLSGRVLGKGQSGEMLSFNGVKLLLTITKGDAGQRLVLERQPMDVIAARIIENLDVAEMGKGSNILRVSSQGTDPGHVRDVVNIVTEVYREMNVAGKTQEAGKTVDFISQQLSGLQEVLDVSEQQLQEYKVQTGLTTLGPEGNSLVQKLVELEQRQAEMKLKRQRVESAIDIIEAAIRSGGPLTVPIIEDVPSITVSAAKLADLDAQKKGMLIDYTTSHPAVVDVQIEINRVREALLSTYQAIHQELLLSERDLARTITDFDAQLANIPEAELELAKRTRVNTVNAELYTFLLQKQQEARIAQASTISNVQIVDPAVTPKVPIKPNKKKNLALGLILGLMLGVGLVFLLDYMDQTIKTSEDVKEKLGLNVLGIIPRIPFADEDARLPRKRLVTTLAAKSPVVESFRALRTNLNFLTAKQKHKIIMVTSSLPDEGKSTISGNLAVVLSQTGAKVLLIGCDLRRPQLFEMFGMKNEPGLVNLLMDNDQDAIRHLSEPRLDFLPAGSIPPNPAEILDSARMARLLDKVRVHYDYVVLDAPPVLPVTDAQILAPRVDVNLVVLEPCRVPEKAALQMIESLRAVDARIAGVILNDKSGRGFKYYGNYNYYGNKYYRGYYGEDLEVAREGVLIAGFKKAWQKLNS
ncbi:MAG: polysaccharide biosynthesis tyrosine autokinase [Desulfuromonadales bacterium]|nr:polysaccharide biosynthesis tyrosine autokinase [Desulfuromonadales bacterium]